MIEQEGNLHESIKPVGKRKAYSLFPTAVTGIAIRIAQGLGYDLETSQLPSFVASARRYVNASIQQDELQKTITRERKNILKVADENQAIRGVEFEDEGVGLSLFPSEKVEWDREKLKEALGSTYSAYVTDEIYTRITVPPAVTNSHGVSLTPELITLAIEGALMDLGVVFPQRIMDTTIVPVVNEKRISQQEAKGNIHLSEGTRRVKRSWVFRSIPLDKWKGR